MSLKLRTWMPLGAVFMVLLSVASIFIYAIPATRDRVSDYVRERLLVEASAAGRGVAGKDAERSQELLDLYAQASGGEALLVDRDGQTVVHAGNGPLDTPSPDLLRKAAEGTRTVEDIGNLKVAIAPVIFRDQLTGGVVLSSGDENLLFRMALRSSLEAAGISAVLGGGLMFLLATLLARRIGRLASGARAIERGDLDHRIEPGPDDELGELAENFNSMAGRLESYIGWLETEREARHTLLDSLTEGVIAATPGGGLLFANKTARDMLGLGDEAPEELPDPWDDFSLPTAVKSCALRRDCGMVRVQSGEIFLQVSLELLPGFDDGEDGVLVVIQDLSEGRRLEADQQRFLSRAAHELKTPITAIVGAAELLSADETQLEPEVRRNLLGYILSEGGRMQRLSDTMLRLARTGRDSRDPELQEVDLGRSARRSAERIEPLARGAGVTVRVRDDGAGRALADPEWLEQTLLILLNNAVQHSGENGHVWLEVSGNGIAVADDGRGIDPDDLPHVFENFYSGRQSSGGFGLGLPICKEMVQRMGGSVSVRSEVGAGTRFELRLARPGENSTEMRRKV